MDAVRVLTRQLPTADILEIIDPNDGRRWVIVDPRVTQEQLQNYLDYRRRAAELGEHERARRESGSGPPFWRRVALPFVVLAAAAVAVVAALVGPALFGLDTAISASVAVLTGALHTQHRPLTHREHAAAGKRPEDSPEGHAAEVDTSGA